eukprot:386693-Pyramimonas_sp.AAC.1
MVASLFSIEKEMEIETWDISTAFLQGLNYKDLKKYADQLGIEIRQERKVHMRLPPNAWRHFRNYEKSNIHISDSASQLFYLMLLKPIYGTVDAPLLWQLALTMFIKEELKGIQSVFDDNFFMWVENGVINMIWTVHVDDIIVMALKEWMRWSQEKTERIFGKVKRHCLPFTHMGMTYELLRGRHLLIYQDKFVGGLSK